MYAIDYEYADKDISAWGVLPLVHESMERNDFRDMLDDAGLPDKDSYRACPPDRSQMASSSASFPGQTTGALL